MWINAFAVDNKVLSPIELLVLATVPEAKATPKDISDRLINSTEVWNPAAGTLYPILDRLNESGLLVKTKDKHLQFARSDKGSAYLTTILKPLFVQIRESQQYYLHLIKSISHLRPIPFGMAEFFAKLETLSAQYSNEIKEMKSKVEKIDEDAFDVPISFER